jgi:hypothetical protein
MIQHQRSRIISLVLHKIYHLSMVFLIILCIAYFFLLLLALTLLPGDVIILSLHLQQKELVKHAGFFSDFWFSDFYKIISGIFDSGRELHGIQTSSGVRTFLSSSFSSLSLIMA